MTSCANGAPNPKIPTSQQEAQDTVLRYLQQTLDVLPPGSSLDGSRYRIGRMDKYCEDDLAGPDSPVHMEDWRDVKLPPGTDFNAVIARTGKIWEQWGWQVIERTASRSRTASATTQMATCSIRKRGTRLEPAPFLIGSSPYYPGSLRTDIPRNPPLLLQQQQPAG